MPPVIDYNLCKSCGTCDKNCPGDVISQEKDNKPLVLYPHECWHCGACRQDCPAGAIKIAFSFKMLHI